KTRTTEPSTPGSASGRRLEPGTGVPDCDRSSGAASGGPRSGVDSGTAGLGVAGWAPERGDGRAKNQHPNASEMPAATSATTLVTACRPRCSALVEVDIFRRPSLGSGEPERSATRGTTSARPTGWGSGGTLCTRTVTAAQ